MVNMTEPAEEQLPIDIDYAKFLDWLIDRQRIPRNWHSLLKAARTLTRTALSLTPASIKASLHLPALAPHQHLPHHTVRRALQALTDPAAPPEWGSPEKDILGRYKTPLHRAWSHALSAFDRSHVYLADAAQQLARSADVDAPAIKAAVAKLNADLADSVRREGPAIRAAQDARARFEHACHQFHLPCDCVDFETLLSEQVELQVPDLLTAAVDAVNTDLFDAILTYYDQFASYVAQGHASQVCPTIRRVRSTDIDALTRSVALAVDDAVIDWGVDLSVDVPAPLDEQGESADIDWGIEVDTSGTATEASEQLAEGDVAKESEIGLEGETSGATGQIDWNVGVVEAQSGVAAQDGGDLEEEEENLTLTDPSSRERYLTDLLELQAFLVQRAAELSVSAGSEIGLVLQQSTVTPDAIKRVDAERVEEMQAAVRQAIEAINGDETRLLLALQSNKKRLEKTARSVVEKKLIAERMEGAIDALRERRKRCGEQLAVEGRRLQELGNVTREVKRWTEEALSGLYRGRCVNILGEINNVFPPED